MNFEEIGYRILRTSTVTGQGIEELRQHIATLKNGKPGTVVFLGQSGSGKRKTKQNMAITIWHHSHHCSICSLEVFTDYLTQRLLCSLLLVVLFSCR